MKTKIFVTTLVLLGVAVAAFYFLKDQNYPWNPFSANPAVQETDSTVDGINFAPATEDDQKEADDAKDALVGQESTAKDETNEEEKPATANKTSVSVIVTFAEDQGATIRVGAFAQSKASGTCTLTATKTGSTTYTATSATTLQPSYYQCDGFTFDQSKLDSIGTWNIVVSFSNEKEAGASQKYDLEVK